MSLFLDACIRYPLLGPFLSYLEDHEGMHVLCTDKDAFWCYNNNRSLTLKPIAIDSLLIRSQYAVELHSPIGNEFSPRSPFPSYIFPRCITNVLAINPGVIRLPSSKERVAEYIAAYDAARVRDHPSFSPFPRLTHLSITAYITVIPLFPTSLTWLEFQYGFNIPLVKGMFPSSLTYLALGNDFNQLIGEDILPSSIQTLYLRGNFNHPLNRKNLPASLIELHLSDYFTQILYKRDLPRSVTCIDSHRYFESKQNERLKLNPQLISDDDTIIFPEEEEEEERKT